MFIVKPVKVYLLKLYAQFKFIFFLSLVISMISHKLHSSQILGHLLADFLWVIRKSLRNELTVRGEIPQQAKCLICKHQDLSPDYQHTHKSKFQQCISPNHSQGHVPVSLWQVLCQLDQAKSNEKRNISGKHTGLLGIFVCDSYGHIQLIQPPLGCQSCVLQGSLLSKA